MPKTSPLDAITQQLDDLSLDQLLEVRARVDSLDGDVILADQTILQKAQGIAPQNTTLVFF